MCCGEFFEETDVVLGEKTEVFDAVFEVGYALDTHTESKTGIFLGVDAACFKHGGVHHAAAEDFHPARTLAEGTSLAAAEVAAYVHLGRWLGEGEVARTETYVGLRTEHLAGEIKEGLAEVGEGHVFVDIQRFDLMEETMRARRNGFIAVYAARADDTDGRLLACHNTSLDR